ncbi:FKBP-type peptidyl-prolyl cis-trans isomerase [Tessaracoccus sp. OS52]|uniref:FKBP-type peptidyl-prolyl cis-trans isomerase n=1 Tax=Tessaracoccus sp. OS52 TaxID=2886691 RepID=UPI001D11EC7B|nr:FKBP-type peptidyl-prolyl cis-trans isomerase [Tessaracoccus sp. OS52]
MSFTPDLSRPRRALVALVAVAGLGLSACGQPSSESTETPDATVSPSASATAEPSPSESPSPTPTIEPASDLEAITVTDGEEPEVEIPAPWAIDETRTKVVTPAPEGGQVLKETSTANLHYAGYNARTGEMFDSSWQRGAPATFQLQQVVPGFTKGLTGQSVGSRVLIAMPSEDGYAQGNPAAGIEVGDTLVFVVDILGANFEEATGEPVAPAAGLPAVDMSSGTPELAKPTGEAPKELVVQTLVKGPGAVVEENSTIQVKHRSWVWGSGELLEDAWRPQQGPLDTLIEGWKQGLAGQTTGSRVMLVIPPELAYPDGSPTLGLDAGQTLVYVIDILDATTQA